MARTSGSLWSSTGTRLAPVTFTDETATGWQQATFANPVRGDGRYHVRGVLLRSAGPLRAQPDYFISATTRGPLTALWTASSGGNGVYRYAIGGGFPTTSYRSSNYWVDVVFATTAADTVKPTVTARTPATGATGVPVGPQ